MSHAFISYVSEDDASVDFVCATLSRNRVAYWRDKNDLKGGERWKIALREAIQKGGYFVAIFSKNSCNKDRSVANQEVAWAIEELQLRPFNRAWFIPVKIEQCDIPARPIGGGETLHDLHWIDFERLGWREGMGRLLSSIGVENPELDHGEPIAPGLGSIAQIRGGELIYRGSLPAVDNFEGMTLSVTGGWVVRELDNGITISLFTRSGYQQMQALNERIGATNVIAFCNEEKISTDPNLPNTFTGTRTIQFSEGESVWYPGLGDVVLPVAMKLESSFTAKGHLQGLVFQGSFHASIGGDVLGQEINQSQWGDFQIQLDQH